MDKVVIYKANDKSARVEVQFDRDTAWLTQSQMVTLFNKDQSVISRHINNVFKENEVEKKSNMHFLHIANSDKPITYYSLDVIISVGYRVKSKQGTQFRIWATNRLKEYLIHGYSINEKRLKQVTSNLKQLEETVRQIQQAGSSDSIQLKEAKGLLEIVSNYTRSLVILSQYDSGSLETGKLNTSITYEIKYTEAQQAIIELKSALIKKKEASDLFGNEKDQSFKGILGNIVQTFGGKCLYSSIEEQAAHLLYFIIKNHPFSDGNKRIGAFLFIWFLERNKHRLKKSGEPKINDNGLAALALLVAQSNPADKELMIKLIINLVVDA